MKTKPSSFRELVEALSPEAQHIADQMSQRAGMEGYYHHDDVFGPGEDRIVMPIIKHDDNIRHIPQNEIPSSVVDHLSKNGWAIHDYLGNAATRTRKYTDPNGIAREKTEIQRISQVLKDNPEASKEHSVALGMHGGASDDEHEVVISRAHQDVAEMSSGRKWAAGSCMRLPGEYKNHPSILDKLSPNEKEMGGVYHHKVESDMKHGTLVATMVKKGDTFSTDPSARVLLKKFVNPNNPNDTIYRPETKMSYGNPTSSFFQTVSKWSKDNYKGSGLSADEDSRTYVKHHELYDDDEQAVRTVSKKPASTYTAGNEIRNETRNDEGQLHSINDQPSSETVNTKTGMIVKQWHKNGVLHRDGDKPAQVTTMKSDMGSGRYVKRQAWFKAGHIHRDGDKPAEIIHREQGENVKETYAKYGYTHREPENGPAQITNMEHRVTHEYMMNGTLHRPVEQGPAQIEISPQDGKVIGYEHKEFGRMKSPSPTTPAKYAFGEHHFEHPDGTKVKVKSPDWSGVTKV